MLDTTNPNSYKYIAKHLEIHILGGIKTNKLESLRVTVSIQKLKNNNVLRHTLDLYNDNQVEKFVRKVAERLEIGTSIVRKTLQEVTRELENYRFLLIQQYEEAHKPYYKELSATEEREAIKFLKRKDLLLKTNELIGKSGVIGEQTNRLLMYLIFTSRKTNNPLHCISLGSSGVGKTHLQSKVAELIPEEDKIEMTVLSANAFYYFNRTELQHKLILIEDLDGAESVLYPLRELQSKKRITKTVVHKDARGNTKTIHLTVEGPVSVAGCTTQESIYEDNSNRNFLLYIDESSEQDIRIMNYQRLISAGKINEETGEVFIETTIEDIEEANELIIEVLLRKSDTLTGATRNHLENLKNYLKEQKQTQFNTTEIRKNLRIKQSTLQRYHKQLLGEGYIKKVKGKKGQMYFYEIIDVQEYTNLKEEINDALKQCLSKINLPS